MVGASSTVPTPSTRIVTASDLSCAIAPFAASTPRSTPSIMFRIALSSPVRARA